LYITDIPTPPRKAAANILAVDERQSLDTLTRDEKTAARALTQLTERQHGLEEKRGLRNEELRALGERRSEVGFVLSFVVVANKGFCSWKRRLGVCKES
jgi:hypothetical protein